MSGNWANLIGYRCSRFRDGSALLRIRSHIFSRCPPPSEQFCLDSDPWIRQFLAMRRTQTHGGVFGFIQQTQEFANVPELIPQSIYQLCDPPYFNALPPTSFVLSRTLPITTAAADPDTTGQPKRSTSSERPSATRILFMLFCHRQEMSTKASITRPRSKGKVGNGARNPIQEL